MQTTKTLAELGRREEIIPGHFIMQDERDYLVLVVKATLDHAASRFKHPNIAARGDRLLHFKHDHPVKHWTSRAGHEIYFVLPKTAIRVLPMEGYSYPHIEVGGEHLRLNVSGGTHDGGWADTIRSPAETTINLPRSVLRALATAAMTPEQVATLGIVFKPCVEDASDRVQFADKATRHAVLADNRLQAGSKVVLRRGLSVGGEAISEPLCVESDYRRRQRLTAVHDRFGRLRVNYKDMDWVATAQANGWVDRVAEFRGCEVAISETPAIGASTPQEAAGIAV